MKTNTVCVLMFSMVFLSCTHTKKDLIIGTWKGIKLENTAIDSFFIKSQHLIDTMGKKNTPDENYAYYNTYNMDSLRHEMQLKNDSAKAIEYSKIFNTTFRFEKNKIAYISFNANATTDTSKWNFDDEGSLILEDLSVSGESRILRMGIISLNDSLMQLKIFNNNDSSLITFRHVSE